MSGILKNSIIGNQKIIKKPLSSYLIDPLLINNILPNCLFSHTHYKINPAYVQNVRNVDITQFVTYRSVLLNNTERYLSKKLLNYTTLPLFNKINITECVFLKKSEEDYNNMYKLLSSAVQIIPLVFEDGKHKQYNWFKYILDNYSETDDIKMVEIPAKRNIETKYASGEEADEMSSGYFNTEMAYLMNEKLDIYTRYK